MSTVSLQGGAEVRRALAAFDPTTGAVGRAALKAAYARVGYAAAVDTRAAAMTGTKLQRKMADAIRPKVNARSAGISIRRTGVNKAAGVAFFGTDRRLGWFARSRYNAYNATHQKLPPWVGNTWKAATVGQGPHVINAAMAANLNKYRNMLDEGLDSAARQVGLK